MHNDVIRSDIHSTDKHGYNETIFGVTHLLGLPYAPKIKNIGKQQLYHWAKFSPLIFIMIKIEAMRGKYQLKAAIGYLDCAWR